MDSGGSNSSTRIPRRDTAPSSLNSSIVHTPAEFLTEFLDARRHWTPVSVAAPFLYLLFFQMFILVYFQDNFEQRGMKPLGFFHASLLAGNAILSPFVVHGFCCAFWGTLARKKLIVQDKVQDPKQHEVAAKYTSFVCLLWFLCYAFVPMFSVFLQGNRVICFACPKRYRLSCHTLTLALLGQYTTATQPHRRCTVHDMNNISVGLVYDVAVCVCVHDDVDDSTGAVYRGMTISDTKTYALARNRIQPVRLLPSIRDFASESRSDSRLCPTVRASGYRRDADRQNRPFGDALRRRDVRPRSSCWTKPTLALLSRSSGLPWPTRWPARCVFWAFLTMLGCTSSGPYRSAGKTGGGSGHQERRTGGR